MWKEWREFVARGNVIDLAVGVIMGAAFGKIVTTVVEGIVMPPLGLLFGRVDFASLFYTLDRSKGIPASLGDAKAQGIPVIAFGQLLNDIASFLVIALVVFIVVKQVNRLKRLGEAEPEVVAPATRDCAFCMMPIPIKATRCPHCTSQV